MTTKVENTAPALSKIQCITELRNVLDLYSTYYEQRQVALRNGIKAPDFEKIDTSFVNETIEVLNEARINVPQTQLQRLGVAFDLLLNTLVNEYDFWNELEKDLMSKESRYAWFYVPYFSFLLDVPFSLTDEVQFVRNTAYDNSVPDVNEEDKPVVNAYDFIKRFKERDVKLLPKRLQKAVFKKYDMMLVKLDAIFGNDETLDQDICKAFLELKDSKGDHLIKFLNIIRYLNQEKKKKIVVPYSLALTKDSEVVKMLDIYNKQSTNRKFLTINKG